MMNYFVQVRWFHTDGARKHSSANATCVSMDLNEQVPTEEKADVLDAGNADLRQAWEITLGTLGDSHSPSAYLPSVILDRAS